MVATIDLWWLTGGRRKVALGERGPGFYQSFFLGEHVEIATAIGTIEQGELANITNEELIL